MDDDRHSVFIIHVIYSISGCGRPEVECNHSHGHSRLFSSTTTSSPMYTGYGSASPPLTNNPFLTQTAQSVTSRFPDISNDNNPSSFASWGSASTMTGGGLPQQQQPSSYQQVSAQIPYGSPQGYAMNNTGYISPTQTFPSPPPFQMQGYDNTFGQQFNPHVSGSSYSYLSGTQQQPNSSYNPAQQQLQNNPGYIAQFDPYGAVGQGWDGGAGGTTNNNNNNHFSSIRPSMSTGSTLSSAASTSSSFSGSSFGVGPKGDSHPRDYIRTHKSQVEAWDSYAWKQLLNSFETLKSAWDERKSELVTRAKSIISQGQTGMGYGGYFAQQIQQEATTVQHVCCQISLHNTVTPLTDLYSFSKRQNQTLVCLSLPKYLSYLRSPVF